MGQHAGLTKQLQTFLDTRILFSFSFKEENFRDQGLVNWIVIHFCFRLRDLASSAMQNVELEALSSL